ncbi:MAG: thiamine-phosphate kinase [Nitrospirota bacterium]
MDRHVPRRSRHRLPSLRLSEFQLIADLHRRFGRTGPSVLRGIGDDAALIRLPPGRQLLVTTDLLAEGVHFVRSTASMEEIGYKAAIANLSDIAAMGGVPRYLLVSLAIPPSHRTSEVRALYSGLMRACRSPRVELVGGDTSESRGGLFIGVALLGTVRPNHALRRDGARIGDLLYVTGTLGDALAGLELLAARRNRRSRGLGPARFLIGRHLRPAARIREGQLLAEHRLATAAIDLSDGLSGDLAHLCRQSGVGAEIEAAALPLSPQCRAYAKARGRDPVALALTGGEDYELLFTVPPRLRETVERLVRAAGCRCTRIGVIRPKAFGLRVRQPTGSLASLSITSYQHFRPARAGRPEP